MKKYSWFEPSLQGLAYWIGYKRQLYRHHDLPEAAIVSEFVTLILAHRKETEKVFCEKSYESLGVSRDQTRADIVVMEGDKPTAVIEVKRYGGNISKDLERLSVVKRVHPDVDCFLLVASQEKLPSKFVDRTTGLGKRGNVSDTVAEARVIRVCKAAHSFEKISRANYVCMIQIR
jgi:hypothetical protein